MRILHILNHLGWGGIEAFLLNALRVIHECGLSALEFQVCCVGSQRGERAAEMERLGIPVWACREEFPPFRFIRRLSTELRARGPFDVVHAHGGLFAGPMLAAARRAGVPVRIAHHHNLHAGHANDMPRRLYAAWMRRQVLRSATAIAGCSRAVLRQHYGSRIDEDPRMVVIRNSAAAPTREDFAQRDATRATLGAAADATLVGHVGRFAWQKNHETLIRAARRVVDRDALYRFVLVGDGELRPKIEALAGELGLGDNVVFCGLRRDVSRLLPAMDLFVLPSVAEAFGVAAVEAQRAGLPVVAADLPGIREATAPEFHAYLRDPKDVDGLADALLTLGREARATPALAAAARAFGDQFTPERSAAALLNAWRCEPVLFE
jgi:glycosyltransferase EpsF